MNKLSKIFLGIIIVLSIALIIITFLYVNAYNSSNKYLNDALYAADILFKANEAIYNAGLETKVQDDGTFKLVERVNEIERVTE